MTSPTSFRRLAIAGALAFAATAAAQTPDPDPVLIENSIARITRSDYELELTRLPAELRGGFANSERRVHELLRRMLVDRTLAELGRRNKVHETPDNARRIAADLEKMIAQLMVARLDDEAGARFDANRAKQEVRAKELYTIERKRFVTPERLRVSHILFDTKRRSADEALKLARETRAKVVAGADFNEMAREVSDDRTAKQNAGRIDWFEQREMDPRFSAAAFALQTPGQVSEPVQSSFGWHLIRLEGRQPSAQRSYDEVREQILVELRDKYIADEREAALAKIRDDATTRANQAAIDAIVVRVDRDAVRRIVNEVAPGALAPAAK